MKTRYTLALAAAMLALTSCQREQLVVLSTTDAVTRFDVSVAEMADAGDGAGTKASLINTTGDNTHQLSEYLTEFQVAAWEGTSGNTNFIPAYTKVKYQESGLENYWSTVNGSDRDVEYIWKKDATTKTFFAHANLPTSDASISNTSAASQTLELTALPDEDILMGCYSGNGNETGTAGIHFYHPLTAVKFKQGTLSAGVSITGISIEGVYTSGKTTQTVSTGVNFAWTKTDGSAFAASDETGTASLSDITVDGDGFIGEAIVLIPQTFASDGARIAVRLSNGSILYTVLAGTQWKAGYTNIYTIGYDPLPDELLGGRFSISSSEYVQFSRGNLYCTRSGEEGSYTYEFGLERNQYDFRTRPGYPSVINGVYAEEGTGPNMSGHFYWDIAKAQAGKDYGAFSTTAPSGGTTSDVLDWGPALDVASHWTTLSSTEWEYLVKIRKVKSATGLHNTCEFVYFKGVDGLDNGVEGLIIYPDDYDGEMLTNQQEITAIPDECVFIPMAGKFSSGTETYVTERCNYWTSSAGTEGVNALNLTAYGTNLLPDHLLSRANGLSVRLVQRFPKTVEYVEIAGLKWATENLAITESGKKEWEGTGHIVGDYFQWGAYAGYCGNVTDADKGLVLYESFTCKGCGDVSDLFTMKTGKKFNTAFAPFNKGTSPYSYLEYVAPPATLANEHDAANIVLGGKWRMPTTDEIVAMRNATYWVWDDTDKGYYICSPSGTCEAGGQGNAFPSGTDKTDAMLFIPASGYAKYGSTIGNKLFQSTIVCDIWTSSLNEYETNNAYNLYFGGTGADPIGILPGYNNSRYMGFSIRPVADK